MLPRSEGRRQASTSGDSHGESSHSRSAVFAVVSEFFVPGFMDDYEVLSRGTAFALSAAGSGNTGLIELISA